MTDHDALRKANEMIEDQAQVIIPEREEIKRLKQLFTNKERETIERCAQVADKEAKSLEIGGPTEASIVARYIAQNIRALETKP